MSSWALAAAAGVVISYAGLSRRLEGTPVSAPIFFLSAGLLLGSEGFGWIGLSATGEQVRVLAELTLTLVLFADASRIDLSALRREYTVPAINTFWARQGFSVPIPIEDLAPGDNTVEFATNSNPGISVPANSMHIANIDLEIEVE